MPQFAVISVGDIGQSVQEAFFMFWVSLWALVFGFGLSGVVQAFVSKDDLQRVMGDHGPASAARATGFGMVSSSCSYAATAMAKSLFQKGADFPTAAAIRPHDGRNYLFCNVGCADAFDAEPDRYASASRTS